MKDYTLIKTRDVTNDTRAKYRELVDRFETEIKLNFQKMLKSPNFYKLLNDLQLTNPEIIEIRQPTKSDYGRTMDDPIKEIYDGTLFVNDFVPKNYGLPSHFNQVKDLLSFAYGLLIYFSFSVTKIYEVHEDWGFSGQNHLFKNLDDFWNYINNTCGYKMQLTHSTPFMNKGDYVFKKAGLSWFSSDYDYGIVSKCWSFYLPCRIILYRKYTEQCPPIKVAPSWY